MDVGQQSYQIEVAQGEDIVALQVAAEASWRATYASIFTPDFITRFLARAYSVESLRRTIQSPNSCFLVVKCETAQCKATVLGFGQVGSGQPRRDGKPVAPAELYRLYVVPSQQRQGLGSRLLAELEAWLLAQGYDHYACYVHARNELGKAFYQRQGFVHTPASDFEDEWYMVKGLKQ